MKKLFKNQRILLALFLVGTITMSPFPMSAQTFNVLHTFTNSPDGSNPVAGLILSNNVLFGVSQRGGTNGTGMVFRMNTDGTDFTNLHSFAVTGTAFTNSDGAFPGGYLLLSGNMLYGVTFLGGTGGNGTVYALDTGGMNFTNLHDFSALTPGSETNSDGVQPEDRLILHSNTLYGVTFSGGVFGVGVLFSVGTSGAGFTNFYSFNTSGGYGPESGVILLGNMLYGAASAGYDSSKVPGGSGTIYAVQTNGTGFTNLYSFGIEFTGGNSDGAHPQSYLVLSGNTLYGTTSEGGSSDDGTIFRINTDGTKFANVHNFSGSDGKASLAGFWLSGNVLYSTATEGGAAGNGTVYQFNLSNSNLVTLHSFTAVSGSKSTNSDGITPDADLVLASNTLYGVAASGGRAGSGTAFAIALPPSPPLAITQAGTNVLLTWPTNVIGYLLQSTTNLASSAWNNISPAPVIINGANTITNPASGNQTFYRLSQ
jgi:uncharacterized repeat protein (TIGR03803 family)